MTKWVTIKIFTSQFEAEFMKSFLDSCNIQAQILADGIPSSYPHLQMAEGVKLQVILEQVDEAVAILATTSPNK